MTSIKNTLDNIKKLNAKAQDVNSIKDFLLILFQITEIYKDKLKHIIDLIGEIEVNDLKQLKLQKEALSKKYYKIYNEIKLYRQKKGLEKLPEEFEAFWEDNHPKIYQTTWPIERERKNAIGNELAKLVMIDSEHIPFVSKYAFIGCRLNDKYYSEQIGFCPIDKNLLNASVEFECKELADFIVMTDEFDLYKINRIWFIWDTLSTLYNAFNNPNETHTKLMQNDFWEAKKFSALYNMLTEVFMKPQSTYENKYNSDWDYLKIILQKIVNFTIEKNNASFETKKKQKKYVSFSIKGSSIIVKYGDKERSFSISSNTGSYIKAFYKNPYEPIEESLLWAKMVGGSPQEFGGKQKTQLCETRKSVNKRLKEINLPNAFKKDSSRKDEFNSKQKHWFNSKYPIAKPQIQ